MLDNIDEMLISIFFLTGSNLLLHRLLIEKGVPENFQLISFDSDTNLCPAVYVSSYAFSLVEILNFFLRQAKIQNFTKMKAIADNRI